MNEYLYTIAESIQETANVKTLRLLPVDSGTDYSYEAGAFAMTRVLGNDLAPRAFSIASSPGDTYLEITVEKTGKMTTLLHNLPLGAQLVLGPARGKFRIPNPLERPLFFLAGGTGIVPIRAMLRSLAKSGAEIPMTLCYSVRTDEDIIFKKELENFLKTLPQLKLALAVTRGKSGAKTMISGRFTAERIKGLAADVADRDCLLCGSPQFVLGFIKMLTEECQVPRESIRTEQWLQPGPE